MGFTWDVPPSTFEDGMTQYAAATFDTLFTLCETHAVRIQQYLRDNAPWHDDCMEGREYLKAEAFRDDAGYQLGIRVWYDLEFYRQQCGEVPYDWGSRHEQMTFSESGVIAIILPRGEQGTGRKAALGQLADDFWDAVRAVYA